MRPTIARQTQSRLDAFGSGTDHAHSSAVRWLYAKRDQFPQFAILPGRIEGAPPGSLEFLPYRDENGEFSSWLEIYIIHEGFGGEIRNKTASPCNWDENAADYFAGVQQAIYSDPALRAQLLRAGELSLKKYGDEEPTGKGALPWSTKYFYYFNVEAIAPAEIASDTECYCLRVATSTLTNDRGEGGGWGLIDSLNLTNPQDGSYLFGDPTNPDAAAIIQLAKAKSPTGGRIDWWKVDFHRPKRQGGGLGAPQFRQVSDEVLASRYDLTTVVNRTTPEQSAAHFYAFLGDCPGIIGVFEDLYPDVRAVGRELGIIPQARPRVPAPAPARTAARSASVGDSDSDDEIPFGDADQATRAPASSAPQARAASPAPDSAAPAGRQATRQATPSRRQPVPGAVGGSRPVIPDSQSEEVPPMVTPSMARAEMSLKQLIAGGNPDEGQGVED